MLLYVMDVQCILWSTNGRETFQALARSKQMHSVVNVFHFLRTISPCEQPRLQDNTRRLVSLHVRAFGDKEVLNDALLLCKMRRTREQPEVRTFPSYGVFHHVTVARCV